MIIKTILFCVLAYLLGSINSSIIICKLKNVDIKKVGSGNAGATNTVRALGKKYGVIVFLFDFIKGVIPCVIARIFGCGETVSVVGLCAVLGHIYPLYFGFKGGKGVSTFFGVLASVNILVALILGVLVLILIKTIKIVSLSVLITFVILPFTMFILNNYETKTNAFVSIVYTLLVFYTHRENIKRLLNGTENSFKK